MSKFEESNFYKALQDFFINADKKTFLQFLAEFYNRTESIIDKNIIQDDLIKELRELYLEFNEKGIDENIVREKVNYFVENNVKIKDLNSKLNTNTDNIENINSQLDNKANKTDIFTLANMGQDVKEAMTGGAVAVVGVNAVLRENVVNGQITGEKTDFIIGNENILNPNYCVIGRLYSDGIVHTDTDYDKTCHTTYYIPVKENEVVYFSVKSGGNPLAYLGKAFLYNINMVKDSEITSLISLDSTKKFATYTPSKSGFIRFSKEISLNETCVSTVSQAYIEFKQKLTSNIKIDALDNYLNDTQAETLIEEKVELLDKLKEGKNKVNTANSVYGFINTENGSINESTTYKTTDYIKLQAGTSYIISPKCRKFLAYNLDKTAIKTSYQSELKTNYVYTPNEDCYIRFSYYIDDENKIQLEKGTTVTTYREYNYETYVPIEAPNLLYNDLRGKIIIGNGDSIMYGDGWRGGFLKLIGERNNMTYENYGIGGTTIAKRSSEESDTSIVGRIATMRDDADIILLQGGTNDVVKNVPLGEITSGYNAVLDEYTFCGAMESMLKQALLKWVGKKRVFITVHKMKSRGTILTTYLEKAKEICKKWSIKVVDIHNEGGLNTNIDIYKETYTAGIYADGTTGDSTHPNKLGYLTFYVEPIEKEIRAI